ncbi:TetR family transcriptional regulator [Nocardioides silvaticus]|uniref:TetR family transcriptional regulator n=1 Tax=Nocardioides silvaticus TaxID=2201891 RepID=A0A316TCG1_9ACTN|nr:TetR/AcrR family transcriptional regulator [Nocardioides silvaticus]PWN02007.1 TetR family transcriptional regulator [Nocardioides silvaticus]
MSSVAPLRPGPANPDAAAQIRERILDAATECLLAQGLDARLHAAIAERAGISRPTVYKYVGDQAAIVAAILDRELDRFFGLAVPILRTSDDLEAHLVNAIVFVVEYARDHALLQKALVDHPEVILPALTTMSGALVDRVVALFEEQLDRALRQQGGRGSDTLSPRAAAEWAFRIVVSLITTPTRALEEEGTQVYVESLVRLMGIAGAEGSAS